MNIEETGDSLVEDKLPKVDEGARRIANLLFTLHTSRTPLTTEQIISDSDLGYGSGNRASDLKKFQRDRKKLSEQGISIVEVHESGAPEYEEGRWTIDRAHTHAETGIISTHDAELLDEAISEHLRRADIPYRAALERVQVKLHEIALPSYTARAAASLDAERIDIDPIAETVWAAFNMRRYLTFDYRDAAGKRSRRTVGIYGIFSLGGNAYFVGVGKEDAKVRTFRIDRVDRALKPSGSYSVPADFNVNDYLFLPFDLAPGEAVEVIFSFSPGIAREEIESIGNGRGKIESAQNGGFTWIVDARSIESAASFALSHAAMGMRPEAPDSLLASWNDLIAKAVHLHG